LHHLHVERETLNGASVFLETMQRFRVLLLVASVALVLSACNSSSGSPTITTTLAPAPKPIIATETLVPAPTPTLKLPASEADVPRVEVADAKAAFDKGQAVIIDVRSKQLYDLGHVKGALNIPLGDIEANPNVVTFNKHQWIITYCT
jgi:rhodanese-like protein